MGKNCREVKEKLYERESGSYMSERAIVRQRMEIKDREERLQVASVLIGNGYTVREVAVKPSKSNIKKYYIEYYKEEN